MGEARRGEVGREEDVANVWVGECGGVEGGVVVFFSSAGEAMEGLSPSEEVVVVVVVVAGWKRGE
jgi:hypothetical protein